MKTTYNKIRKAIATPSNWVLRKTRLDRLIDLETFEHFFVLGLLFHAILLIFFPDWVVVISAFVVGFGKELWDKYGIPKSTFSAKGAFLTIVGGVSAVIGMYIYQGIADPILQAVLVMVGAFVILMIVFRWWAKRGK